MTEPIYPDLNGKVALVTGASRGIGAAIAMALARQGTLVGLLARNEQQLDRVASDIVSAGGKAFPIVGDLGDPEQVIARVREFQADTGPITLLVNNAGITRDQLLLGLKPDDWEAVIRVNLTGPYHLTRHIIRDMLKVRKGSIVNISSVVALMGNPGQANYVSAKAGLIGFTKALARELASRNIRVNAVAPGFIETDMTASLPDETKETYLKQIPLGRFGLPEEVARTVVFLLSEASSYITGTVINVSGGLYM